MERTEHDPHTLHAPSAERTTLERIGDLHRALATMAAEANAAERARLERLRALERQLERPRRGGWLVATAFMAAASLWIAALASEPWQPSSDGPTAALALPTGGGVTTDGSVDHRSGEPAPHEAQPLPEAPAGPPPAAEPPSPARIHAARPTVAPRRPVATRPKAIARPEPAADPLADLDDCGDDPICGL